MPSTHLWKKIWMLCILYLPLHIYIWVGQWQKPPIKYNEVFGCNVAKYKKAQMVWILLHGIVCYVCNVQISMQDLHLESKPGCINRNETQPLGIWWCQDQTTEWGMSMGWTPCQIWRKQAVLQSSLAQGYSMSQTIPGQRLHAVMEDGWHVSGSNGSRSRMDRQADGEDTVAYKHSPARMKETGEHCTEEWDGERSAS